MPADPGVDVYRRGRVASGTGLRRGLGRQTAIFAPTGLARRPACSERGCRLHDRPGAAVLEPPPLAFPGELFSYRSRRLDG